MEIAVLNIKDNIEEQAFAKLLLNIHPGKQNRIQRFVQYKDRQRCLFADLLVRMVLMGRGFRNADIHFAAQPMGKPVLLTDPQIHFNTSHSGDWIACIFDTSEVGIDVEQVNHIDLSISESYFCKNEHDNIQNDGRPVQKFFEYWTLKESYIKLTGAGLSQPLHSFCITFRDNNIRVEADGSLLPDIYCKQYEIETGYKMAACATHNNFPAGCTVYTCGEVIGSMLHAG